MATNQYVRLFEKRNLYASETSDPVDFGAYKTICAQIRVIKQGSAGTVELQHAATSEAAAFKTLGSSVALTSVGTNDIQYHTNFLRYVRWAASSSVAGEPIIVIDVIAKET